MLRVALAHRAGFSVFLEGLERGGHPVALQAGDEIGAGQLRDFRGRRDGDDAGARIARAVPEPGGIPVVVPARRRESGCFSVGDDGDVAQSVVREGAIAFGEPPVEQTDLLFRLRRHGRLGEPKEQAQALGLSDGARRRHRDEDCQNRVIDHEHLRVSRE
jgi:hypothetical protein